MIKVFSVNGMREADRYTIDVCAVPASELMERAGRAIAEEIMARTSPCAVLAAAGKGNNGGDALVAARILAENGYDCSAFVFSEGGSDCFRKNLAEFRGEVCGSLEIFKKNFGVIIDGVFGTGLCRVPEGLYREAIEKINSCGGFKVSADIPSGLNGDSGLAQGTAVKADLTVAVGEYKTGHFLNDGPDFCGETVRRDIGIVAEKPRCFVSESADFKELFPKRRRNVNKGTFGRSAIIAGSARYPGAAELAAAGLGALRAGAGYSYLAAPACVTANVRPEIIKMPFPEMDGETVFEREILDKLIGTADCIAVGMGLGAERSSYEAVKYLVENYKKKLVIDADGLNALAAFGTDILNCGRECEILLTPHPGEFSRLSGLSMKEISENPIAAAEKFALRHNVTVLLKNAATIITDGKNTVINTTGSPAMAKGGSGDVLSGLLAGILAQGGDIFKAAAASAYIFGRAGELAAEKYNEYSALPGDTAEEIGKAIGEIIALNSQSNDKKIRQ